VKIEGNPPHAHLLIYRQEDRAHQTGVEEAFQQQAEND